MEAATSVAAARGVSMVLPSSQSLRKEWRAVPEHSARNAGNKDLEHSKIGQVDERTIYEVHQGREPADVDFCSITIDRTSAEDIVQQQLHSVARQREELQQIEIELRVQLSARSEIMEMQSTLDAQLKEHANANLSLQEQIHERERTIHELERNMDDKERELHAIRLDNEAAWAKEDLLREQNKELATFRRERDSSEAERIQHIKQIHDLQEHFQEKERQIMELQEQHKVAQETILFKDDQLREAQAWVRRVQEMDTLQSSALQAELRDRTEQYNQLWLGCQRQFADMERLHLHTVQQLQLELADARERNGTPSDESVFPQANSKDVSPTGQNNGSQLDIDGISSPSGNSGILSNGNVENVTSNASTGDASIQAEHVPGVQIAPSSLLGMPTYLPAGQMTALHPFVMHQQGVPNSIPSHPTQSHIGHFHSVPPISSLQYWQSQQVVSEGLQNPTHNPYPHYQPEQNLLRSDANHDYEVSVNGQALRPDYLEVQVSPGMELRSMISSSAEGQVVEPMDISYLVAPQSQQSLQDISAQFHNALKLDSLTQNSETKDGSTVNLNNQGPERQELTAEEVHNAANESSSDVPTSPVNFSKPIVNKSTGSILPEVTVLSEQKNMHTVGKTLDACLLDERALLACIVRTIPPGCGGQIRISSTLPNRLGKMLAPLHWHDYRRKYGKLDDFVASHPELFVIEGDFIQLREGAQEIIAATAAVAKVAAAAAASPPYSSQFPSVAVTPMAEPHRLKSAILNHHSNGFSSIAAEDISSVKNLSKSSYPLEPNGPGIVANGTNQNRERSGLSRAGSKGSAQGRDGSFVGKQRSRSTVVAPISKR